LIDYNPNHIPTKSHKKNHIIPYLLDFIASRNGEIPSRRVTTGIRGRLRGRHGLRQIHAQSWGHRGQHSLCQARCHARPRQSQAAWPGTRWVFSISVDLLMVTNIYIYMYIYICVYIYMYAYIYYIYIYYIYYIYIIYIYMCIIMCTIV
jgi:hypothetical protein